MQIIKNTTTALLPPNVATIGFFDGVHTGHRFLINQMRNVAKERGLQSLLITFTNHPRTVLDTDYVPELLTTSKEKLCLLAETKADYCLSMKFTKSLAHLTAHEFMKQYLLEHLNVKVLVLGYDNHFGQGNDETFLQYKNEGEKLGIEVIHADKFQIEGDCVSSSAIRFCLQIGDVCKAAQLLGRNYCFEGKVIMGTQMGKRLGFPTANIDPQTIGKMLPMDGCYAVEVTLQNKTYAGMMNIGFRPTFSKSDQRSVEVYILNFTSDIYNKELHIDFVQRLRAERRFNSPEELREQLRNDAQKVERMITL